MPLTHELCEQAALEAFNDKWFRRNYLAMAEKYGGVTRAELQTAARVADMGPRLEVVHGIALEMESALMICWTAVQTILTLTRCILSRALMVSV